LPLAVEFWYINIALSQCVVVPLKATLHMHTAIQILWLPSPVVAMALAMATAAG
jgi:hypothetical protein